MMHEQKDRYQRNGIVTYEEQMLMKQKSMCNRLWWPRWIHHRDAFTVWNRNDDSG